MSLLLLATVFVAIFTCAWGLSEVLARWLARMRHIPEREQEQFGLWWAVSQPWVILALVVAVVFTFGALIIDLQYKRGVRAASDLALTGH